jgi:RimJ/RimL family protein N-acetyltransferase
MIETARLILRPMTEADIAPVAAGLDNFNVSRHTGRIPFPYSEADAADFLAWHRGLGDGSLTLCADIKGGRQAVGMFSYQKLDGDAAPELGYWLAEDVWGKGYGFEAARAMADNAFHVDGHTKLVASYHLGNEASRKILERIGFRFVENAMGHSLAQGRDVPIARVALDK